MLDCGTIYSSDVNFLKRVILKAIIQLLYPSGPLVIIFYKNGVCCNLRLQSTNTFIHSLCVEVSINRIKERTKNRMVKNWITSPLAMEINISNIPALLFVFNKEYFTNGHWNLWLLTDSELIPQNTQNFILHHDI